jgi:hypothetical protein
MPDEVNFRVTAEALQLVHAAVAFANLRRLRSSRQVEGLFMRLPFVARPFKTIPRRDVGAYLQDQAELRLWLSKVAELGSAARPLIGPAVAQRLGTVAVRLSFDAAAGRLQPVYQLDGVQACYSLAVALLLDVATGLTGRVAHCGWSRCGRFWLALSPRGRPRRYCSAAHRRKADQERAAERVRRWRQRQRTQGQRRGGQ